MIAIHNRGMGNRSAAGRNPVDTSRVLLFQNDQSFELLLGCPVRDHYDHWAKSYLYRGACPIDPAFGHGCCLTLPFFGGCCKGSLYIGVATSLPEDLSLKEEEAVPGSGTLYRR